MSGYSNWPIWPEYSDADELPLLPVNYAENAPLKQTRMVDGEDNRKRRRAAAAQKRKEARHD